MRKRFCILLCILYSFLLFATENEVILKSDTGTSTFNNEDISILVLLVNDLDKTLEIWSKPDSEGFPKINTTNKTSSNNGIAPFIIYSLKGNIAVPIYIDMELIKPNGEKSKNTALNFPLISKKPLNNNLYCAERFYGWGFDDSDQKGNYIIHIRIFNENGNIVEYEMIFILE